MCCKIYIINISGNACRFQNYPHYTIKPKMKQDAPPRFCAENRPARNRSGGPVSSASSNISAPSPRPARRRNKRCECISGSGVKAPSGCPVGSARWCRPHRAARCAGGRPGEGRESRGQRPLAPSAEDNIFRSQDRAYLLYRIYTLRYPQPARRKQTLARVLRVKLYRYLSTVLQQNSFYLLKFTAAH